MKHRPQSTHTHAITDRSYRSATIILCQSTKHARKRLATRTHQTQTTIHKHDDQPLISICYNNPMSLIAAVQQSETQASAPMFTVTFAFSVPRTKHSCTCVRVITYQSAHCHSIEHTGDLSSCEARRSCLNLQSHSTKHARKRRPNFHSINHASKSIL
jgi:hypothetical protein